MNSICRFRRNGSLRQPADNLINVIQIVNNKSNKSLHKFILAASQFSCLSHWSGLKTKHSHNESQPRVNNLGNFQFVKSNRNYIQSESIN
jgi:hypothetical protein